MLKLKFNNDGHGLELFAGAKLVATIAPIFDSENVFAEYGTYGGQTWNTLEAAIMYMNAVYLDEPVT